MSSILLDTPIHGNDNTFINYYPPAWINPNQEASNYLIKYFCKNISAIIVNYESKFCLEVDDQSNRVSENEIKFKYIDTDVLEVEFVPKNKPGRWLSILYPYSFPTDMTFPLSVYRDGFEKIGGVGTSGDNDIRNDWYPLNLLCQQCIPKVDLSQTTNTQMITHEFNTTPTPYLLDYRTPCTGTIKWKVVYDGADTLYYYIKKCVWSFHTSNVYKLEL